MTTLLVANLAVSLCLVVALVVGLRVVMSRLRGVSRELRRVAGVAERVATTTGSTKPLVEQTREIVGRTEYNVRAMKAASEERTATERDVAWLRSAWEAREQPEPSSRDAEARRARWADPSQLRVAAILDEFSFTGFAPECELIELLPNNWREVMSKRQPDLFLCESAWSGRDPVAHPWQGKIYTRKSAPQDRRAELLAILDYCRLRGIPTVFWNKEDPVHSLDPERNFVRTALEFDYIFTTDEGSLERYASLGRPDAQVLKFAYQPSIYRPPTPQELEEHPRDRTVVFAGGWYADHPERGPVMEQLFDTVIASPYELVIYDRYSGQDDPLHVFPDKYLRFCRPAVSQDELARVYRRTMFGLTVNTVTDSTTMYARRAYEMLASGAVVLSNYSVGLERDFGEHVLFLDRHSESLERLKVGDIKSRGLNGSKAVEPETFGRRLGEVLDAVLAQVAV